MQLVVDRAGSVHGIYGETIDLSLLGQPTIRRASHVEPDTDGHWWADLSPIGGQMLGPFDCRSQALASEVRWLEEHWLLAQPARS